MKTGLLLILGVGISYFAYHFLKNNPTVITDPVYVEARINVEVPEINRTLQFVLLGEMASLDDCQNRSNRFTNRLFEKCTICTVHTTACKTELSRKNKGLFSDKTINTSYLRLDRGNRFERSGRMVIWGLSKEEAKSACTIVRREMKTDYSGTISCVDS